MEELNGVTIYWLISIGLIVGYVMELIMGRRGMKMAGNLFWGTVSSVVIGIVAILLEIFGALIFATLGAIAFLFLVNIFSTHPGHKPGAGIAPTTSE